MVLITRTTAASVKSLDILTCSKGLFRDGDCVIAMSCGGSYVGDVAGAWSQKSQLRLV
jgi:hypothetical protein